jgi:hypothetical protein
MNVEFDDTEYQFDLDDIDVTQARYLKRKIHMTLMDLEEGMLRADPDALVGLYWLMLAQNGKVVDIDKLNFKLVRFGIALQKAVKADRAANPTEEPDEPTVPETT